MAGRRRKGRRKTATNGGSTIPMRGKFKVDTRHMGRGTRKKHNHTKGSPKHRHTR